MATNYTGNPMLDPDSLTYAKITISSGFAGATDELLIDAPNRLIALKVKGSAGGDLTTDGVTIKCVYSKLKEIWRTDTDLIKYAFPMGPITDEQFEMVNGWNWDKTQTSGDVSATTPELLRTGGWSVVNTSGNVTEYWTGVVTLGTFISTSDQAYYQQVSASTASVNFKLTGPVNQAVQILRDDDGDGNFSEGSDYDRRAYLKIFVREYSKLYAQSSIGDIGVTSLTYQAYRYPLSNANDLKISHIDAAVGGVATTSGSWAGGSATINTAAPHGLVSGETVKIAGVTPSGYNGSYVVTVTDTDTFTYTVADPGGVITVQGTSTKEVYTQVDITYLRHSDDTRYTIRGDYADATLYNVADVVRDASLGTPRWFKNTGSTATSSGATLGADTSGTTWEAYEGERLIGSSWQAFTVIVDADNTVATTASGDARTTEIYEKVQWLLRQNADIDIDATASVNGKTADSLLRFVGDTLVTSKGVYIDSFNSLDTNAIEFYDGVGTNGTLRTFPYVANLTINFGDNLQNDQFAKYWVFFTSGVGAGAGNDYGTANAIIVKDNAGVDISGNVNPAWPTKRAFVPHTFNYDGNNQRSGGTYNSGSGSQGTDAPITVVGIGLSTGQFVRATGNIAKSTGNSVSLVAALERNYANP